MINIMVVLLKDMPNKFFISRLVSYNNNYIFYKESIIKKLKVFLFLNLFIFNSHAISNSVNMAPIVSYLLSATASAEHNDFIMTLDVNESTVIGDWKELSSAKDLDAVATVLVQGNYGTFVVTGDSLAYLKTVETNETDTGVLEIIDGAETVELIVSVNSIYWKMMSA